MISESHVFPFGKGVLVNVVNPAVKTAFLRNTTSLMIYHAIVMQMIMAI